MADTPNEHGQWLTWGTQDYVTHMTERLAPLPGWTEEKARARAEQRMADRLGQSSTALGPVCTHCGSIQ